MYNDSRWWNVSGVELLMDLVEEDTAKNYKKSMTKKLS